MDKNRVYDLAKDLNTTSKRLMEKLAEINIVVKNHMSLLSDEELAALYKHIGVIKHSEKNEDSETKNENAPETQPKPEIKREIKKGPRIIRTTQIIIDSKSSDDEYTRKAFSDTAMKNRSGTDQRTNKDVRRPEFIKAADSNSGLISGMSRKTDSYSIANKRKENIKKESTEQVKDKVIKQNEEKLPEIEIKKDAIIDKKIDVSEKKSAVSETQKAVEEATISKTTDTEKQKTETIIDSKTVENKETKASEESNKTTQKVSDREKIENNTKSVDKPRTAYVQRSQSTGYSGQRPQSTGYSGQRSQSTGYSGQRPQSTGYSGQKPQGTGFNQNRPQRTTSGYDGNRPQGDRNQAPRDFNKSQGSSTMKPFNIPKPEMSDSIKEELNAQKSGIRREFQSKDADRNLNREQKREMPKGTGSDRNRKFNPQSAILGQKKGVSEVLSEDFILEEFYTDDEGRRRRRVEKNRKMSTTPKYIPPREILTSITIPEYISVKDFAEAMKKTSTVIIKKLMDMGVMATLNQDIDFDTACLIADEFGIKAEKALEIKEEDILFDESQEDEKDALPRPPVVVVMGHVDHGKTSLLDAIRQANVIESESGGITQHIGAYTVKVQDKNITFLDTPGHEAFTAMRARGAQITDIAILVVAADDGVMPQTIEAINHAKAANVAIIVAVNKIDKPGANPDKIKQELTEYGLVAEEWGGDVIFVEVSAKEKTNIDLLLENVLISADVLELKADPNKQAKGTIIEAKLDKKRGPVATVLVQRGTLKTSDSIVTGTTVGRIRAMVDDKGREVDKAGPSTPVKIIGLPEVPEAGEIFYAIEDEKIAKNLAEKRKLKIREKNLNTSSKITLDDLYSQIIEGKVKDLNLIIKADVQGSVEALKQSLENL